MALPAAGPWSPRCQAHPRAAAGWECTGCGQLLCPDCVAISDKRGTVELHQCTRCGDVPRELTAHRNATPYGTRLRLAWRYPLTKSGLLSLAATGLVLSVLFGLPWFAPLGICTLFAYVFNLVRQTAGGSDELQVPDMSNLGDLVFPALRGFLGLWLPFLPALAYLNYGSGWEADGLFKDPLLWVALLGGLLYSPMMLLVGATNSGLLALLNPVGIFGLMLRLGWDYLRCAGVLLGLALLEAGLFTLLAWSGALGLVLPLAWLPWTVLLYLPLVMARVLGLLLFTRGDQIGFGMAQDYQVALLSERPRGTPRVVERIAQQHQPIELEEEVERFRPPEPPRSQPPRPVLRELDPALLPPLDPGEEEPS